MGSVKFDQFRARYQNAIDAGLIAAAYQYRNEVVRRLMKGYTTGDFTHGYVAKTVTVSPPFDGNGVRLILVGTNTPYAAYWEFGHHNLFTRRYERVEHWAEARRDSQGAQTAAFNRAFWRALNT